MISDTTTCYLDGLNANIITVEAEILRGISAFYIVGLASASIQESKERIRVALNSAGYSMPMGRIVINLVPANVHKIGTHFDLPIAISLLSVMGKVKSDVVSKFAFLGELSLDGSLRPVDGCIAMICALKEKNITNVILPKQNAKEASIIDGMNIYPAVNLMHVVKMLRGETEMSEYKENCGHQKYGKYSEYKEYGDYADIIGNASLKRFLTIAAAGRHSVLLIGSPGVGKTMALTRFPSIFPELTKEEQIECMKIANISDKNNEFKLIKYPPMRSPHYSITQSGLIGGGVPPKPGEITRSHNGILYLDELTEFSRKYIDLLRTPIEQKKITLSRGTKSWTYPADFQLVCSMNPCPCGNHGNISKECTCSASEIRRYLNRISRPFLDRIDIRWEMTTGIFNENNSDKKIINSSIMKDKVCNARKIQKSRYSGKEYRYNSEIPDSVSYRDIGISDKEHKLLVKISEKYGFSVRGMRKSALIARTIADIENMHSVSEEHILEAVQYRIAARKYWRD